MNKENHKSWIDGCEKLVMVLLCILMADCAAFGAGKCAQFKAQQHQAQTYPFLQGIHALSL